MKRYRNPSIILLLTVVYALIVLSPLAPLALKSPVLAHAITGECSGDCDICGCAPERSASRTCCCWMKKMREQEALATRASCCLPGESGSDCCPRVGQKPAGACCAAGKANGEPARQATTVYRCAPCGKGTLALAWGTESYQHLPHLFTGNLLDTQRPAYAKHHRGSLMSRHREPPDPPPETLLPA